MLTDTPPDWQAALRHIVAAAFRRVLVLGAPNAGKSTFCRLLLPYIAEVTRPAALLDADPGQKLFGPPACITLARSVARFPPTVSGLVFLGSTDPLSAWPRLISGSRRLAAMASAERLVVNTCGLLQGPGRRLKSAMISALQPDLLIAIGEDLNLERVLRDHANIPVCRLASSAHARRKGEGERRALRRAAFQAYFENARDLELSIEGVSLRSGDGGSHPSPGRLAALMDQAGNDLAFGLVLEQEVSDRLLLRTPEPGGVVAGLRWGTLGLDQDWAEAWTACASGRG
jgi:polynucleotide 5'-hydroxyl-kinase GRC3/NOL9